MPQHSESPNDEASGYNVQLGLGYLQQGNLVVAKEKLERALRESPRSPKVHSAMGLLYERLGDPKRADEEYRTALRYAPKDPEVANNYAVFLCKSDRTEEGVKYFLEAARNPLYRTPEAAYTNIAVCLRAAHRDEEAKENLQRALSVKPNFAEAAYQLTDLEFAARAFERCACGAHPVHRQVRGRRPIFCCSACASHARWATALRPNIMRARCAWIFRPRSRRAHSPTSTAAPARKRTMTPDVPAARPSGIGARLRAARERHGMTLTQACRKTARRAEERDRVRGGGFAIFRCAGIRSRSYSPL